MTAPKEILDLVERFNRNRDAYKSAQYNETQLRREFLDPFFISIGWDVENRQGLAEAYKDVVHEDAIKIGGRVHQGARLLFPDRRHEEILRRGEEAGRGHPTGRKPRLPVAPVRLVRQAALEHPHRF